MCLPLLLFLSNLQLTPNKPERCVHLRVHRICIRSCWMNQITGLFVPRETKTEKYANHGSVYIHTPIQQKQSSTNVASVALLHSLSRNDGPMSPSCCHFFPTQIFGIYSLLCIFQPFSFFVTQSLVLLLLNKFPNIASLTPLFPLFLPSLNVFAPSVSFLPDFIGAVTQDGHSTAT